MNQLTEEEIRKASLEAGMQEHYMGFHSGFLKFARAVIEADHKRLFGVGMGPVAWKRKIFSYDSDFKEHKPYPLSPEWEALYTAEQLAAARLQGAEEEREKTEVALGQFRWAAKQMNAAHIRIAKLEAQLAEQAMKIATLEGIK